MGYRDETLTGQDLTERESDMLAAFDGGASFNDLAERFGYASPNGAGNVVRRALTKAGRGSEVRASGGGGGVRAPRVRSATDSIDGLIEQTEATLAMLRERIANAESMASDKPADIMAAERERLAAVIERANKAMAEFEAMDASARKAFVDGVRERNAERVASTREATEGQIAESEKALEGLKAAREAISAV